MSAEPVLSPEEIAGVLGDRAAGAAADDAPPAPGPQPYSLREPLAIAPDSLGEAQETMRRFTALLARPFASSGSEFSFTFEGLQQQRAQAAISALPSPVWVVSIARAGGGGLALALDPVVGLALVDLSLGGPGPCTGSGREPTALEARVLTRVLGATVEGQEPWRRANDRAEATLEIGRVAPSVASADETLAVGLLRVRTGGTDRSALLMATPSILASAPCVNGAEPKAVGPLAPLLERLPTAARPVLRAGAVNLDELAGLAPGKVLRLDALEDARLELRVADRTPMAHGRIERTEAGARFVVDQRIKRGRRDDR